MYRWIEACAVQRLQLLQSPLVLPALNSGQMSHENCHLVPPESCYPSWSMPPLSSLKLHSHNPSLLQTSLQDSQNHSALMPATMQRRRLLNRSSTLDQESLRLDHLSSPLRWSLQSGLIADATISHRIHNCCCH